MAKCGTFDFVLHNIKWVCRAISFTIFIDKILYSNKRNFSQQRQTELFQNFAPRLDWVLGIVFCKWLSWPWPFRPLDQCHMLFERWLVHSSDNLTENWSNGSNISWFTLRAMFRNSYNLLSRTQCSNIYSVDLRNWHVLADSGRSASSTCWNYYCI